MRKPAFWAASLMSVCCALPCAQGATFYVDPARGAPGNDGSSARPWRTLKEVIDSGRVETREWSSYPYQAAATLIPKNAGAPVKAGDTLLLRSGDHDSVVIQRAYNTAPITVSSEQGQTPRLRKLVIQAAENWIVKGVTISAQGIDSTRKLTLASIASHNYSGPVRNVTVESCSLYSVLDASAWTMSDWNRLTPNAFSVSGTQVTIRDNYIKNIDFGISVSGDSCLIEGNTVENFAGDGLRGLGDDCEFRGNRVMNCYDVNANHDDGFQSWSVGGANGTTVGEGSVYRVRLIGNTIIGYTDPNQPFRGTLQGIGCFDGFYDGWVIENNVIITDHWHGITLSGAKNCRIVNNTVCDLNTTDPGPPWISIGAHKTRGSSSDCLVRNNLTTDLNIAASPTVTQDHNVIIGNPNDFFVNYAGRDLRLKAGCPAIDSGTATLAPAFDILGVARPQGVGVDVGAYEYTTSVTRTWMQGGVGAVVQSRAFLTVLPSGVSHCAASVCVDGRVVSPARGAAKAVVSIRSATGQPVVTEEKAARQPEVGSPAVE